MSYIEITDKFEEVINYLTISNEEAISLSKIVLSYKKIIETFSGQLIKLSEAIKTNADKNTSTLSQGLFAFKDHLLKIGNNNNQLVKNLQLDIIEPLDLYSEHFLTMHSELKRRGHLASKDLKSAQARMEKHKQDYYKISYELETTSRQTMVSDSKERQESAQKLSLSYMKKQENHLDSYIKGILEVNQQWDEYDKTMPGIMEELQQNEESRIHFIKISLEKYLKHYQKFQWSINETIEKLSGVVANINSSNDIRIFVDSHKSKSLVKREEFVNYEDWKLSLNDKEYEVVENESVDVGKTLDSLLTDAREPVAGIESENFSKLIDLVSYAEGRSMFIESLQSKINFPLLSYQNLIQLSGLIKEMLSSMNQENEYNASMFCSLNELSVSFYCIDDGRKKMLANFISPHSIWLDPKRWVQAIEYAVTSKASFVKDNKSKVSKYFEIFGFKQNETAVKHDSIAGYATISQFIYHMIKLNVPQRVAYRIIISSAKRFKIDKEKLILLITELYAKCSEPIRLPAKIMKKDLKMVNFLVKCSKFLPTKDILKLSMVSKECYQMLIRVKYKRILLLKKSIEIRPELRRIAWISLLNAGNVNLDYDYLKNLIEHSENVLGELNSIIEMDVARSYHNSLEITSKTLKTILKVYAYKNQDIGYCQGMNYIAGTLYLVIQKEDMSCKALTAMIRKYSMESLYTNNLKKLEKLFFVLDRLISHKLPEVNEIFKDAWVFSNNFTSAWILTLFSSVFHTRQDVLERVWDIFFISGWKGMFKVCIIILQRVHSRIIDKSFEDILYIMSAIGNEDIFDDSFFHDATQLKIDNRLLNALKREYKNIPLLLSNP